jgi:hypothetical protein
MQRLPGLNKLSNLMTIEGNTCASQVMSKPNTLNNKLASGYASFLPPHLGEMRDRGKEERDQDKNNGCRALKTG